MWEPGCLLSTCPRIIQTFIVMLKWAETSFREVLKTAWLLQIGRTESVQNVFLEAELCLDLTKNLSSWFEKVSSEVSVVVTSSCWVCSWFAAFLLAEGWLALRACANTR